MKLISLIIVLITTLTVNCQTVKNDFDLKTLPTDWIKLTETDSGLIIYNTCDAGNRLLSIKNDNGDFGLLLHGLQEDYSYDILKAYQTENGLLIIEAKWKDSEILQTFSFKWTDKLKGLGIWETKYFNNQTTGIKFVILDRQLDFPIIDQPCVECWDDECDYFPTEIIKKVFEDYVKYNESTDSQDDKDSMLKSLERLSIISNPNELELLLNVWMYYDPTDWTGSNKIVRILNQNKALSIQVIEKRIANPKSWETKDSAPYSDLYDLLKRLKNE